MFAIDIRLAVGTGHYIRFEFRFLTAILASVFRHRSVSLRLIRDRWK